LTSLDQQHGQYKSAERGWLDLLASACRMSDLSRKADYLNALGILYGELRDHAQSLCYYQAALQIHIQQDSGLAPLFCNNIADALVQLGNYAEASAFCAKALSTCPEAFVSWRSAMLGTLGKIFLATGEIAQAIHAFEESIRTHQNHETLLNQQVVVQHKTYLGRAHLLQKDFAQALHHAEQGLQLARQTQFKFGEIEALHQIYEIYKHMGALALALDYHEQWITLKQCIMKDKADQRLKFIDATYQVRSQLKRIEQPRVSAAILETHVANRTAQLRQKQGALVLALMLTDAARIS
jgi:tetratricopeptide (TPR) repeat protein